jgi:dolichol-phosphate mannosyltransferase
MSSAQESFEKAGPVLINGKDGNPFSLQIMIAALDEEPGIGATLSELFEMVGNVPALVIDGNSRDKTVEIAKNLGADVVCQEGLGKGDALSKGLEYIRPDVNYVILTDGDYTYPAEYVPAMVRILQRYPRVGMVCGNRFNGNVDGNALRNQFYFGNKLLALAHNLLNGVLLQDPLTGLRVVRAEIMRDWQVKSKGFDVEVELNHHVERMGFTIVEVPIQYRERLGQKKLKIRHGASILRRILLETSY